MRGGNRPAFHARDQQPGACRQQCRHHAVDHQFRVVAQLVRIDNALAYRRGDLTAREVGAGKLEDHGNQDGLLDGQRPRPYRGAHGIGHVIGAYAPGHEEAEEAGHHQEDRAVLGDDFHQRVSLARDDDLETVADGFGNVGELGDQCQYPV